MLVSSGCEVEAGRGLGASFQSSFHASFQLWKLGNPRVRISLRVHIPLRGTETSNWKLALSDAVFVETSTGLGGCSGLGCGGRRGAGCCALVGDCGSGASDGGESSECSCGCEGYRCPGAGGLRRLLGAAGLCGRLGRLGRLVLGRRGTRGCHKGRRWGGLELAALADPVHAICTRKTPTQAPWSARQTPNRINPYRDSPRRSSSASCSSGEHQAVLRRYSVLAGASQG